MKLASDSDPARTQHGATKEVRDNVRTKVSQESILRWRSLDASIVLLAIADHAKRDGTFLPIKHRDSTRWHATVDGTEYELLLTGPKFWDTRSRIGGGGAIDLVMHLARVDFSGAAARLTALRL